MGKLLFSGDRLANKKKGLRSYVDPKIYNPTTKIEKNGFHLPKQFGYISIIVILGLGWLYFIFYSAFFRINNIQIHGDAKTETIAAVEQIRGKNIFLIGGKKAENDLIEKQPGIKKIKIIRGLPSSVIIELVERDGALVWGSEGKKYLVDKDGVIYKEVQDSSGLDYPYVLDNKNIPVVYGSKVVTSSFISYIGIVKDQLFKETGLDFDFIAIPETTFQIEVMTKNNLKIKINTERNISDQLSETKQLLEKNRDKIKEYLDVRVEGYGYIK